MNIQGSRLCGQVRFEVGMPFERLVYCHCSGCRKATGTAYATNATVKAGAFRWLAGKEFIARYDLPTARSFATAFCRNCGSPMPHLTRTGREAIDTDPECRPEGHVHWSSRATLFAHGEALPKDD